MSFSKVVRDRIRAGKNVLLNVAFFSADPWISQNPDQDLLDQLNQFPLVEHQTLFSVPLGPIDRELLEEINSEAASSMFDTFSSENLAASWHEWQREREIEYEEPLTGVPDIFNWEAFQRDQQISSLRQAGFVAVKIRSGDWVTITREELSKLENLSPILEWRINQSTDPLFELDINGPTLFLLLKLIRHENLYLFDYKPRALEKIRSEAAELKCQVLVKEIDKFENRFKS